MSNTNPHGISDFQKRFAEEYLIDNQGGPAYRRAGGKAKDEYVAASTLLRNAKVAAYVAELMDKRSERTEISADRVMLELARLGLSDVRKLFTERGDLRSINDLDDDTAAAIQSIEVVTRQLPRERGDPVEVEYVHKVKMADKVKPLEMIGRHLGKRLGQWSDKTEHDVPPDSPLASLISAINGNKSTLQPNDDQDQ